MRSLALTAAALALFSVTACGSDDEPAVASTDTAASEAPVTTPEPSESPTPTTLPTKVAPDAPKETPTPAAPKTASKKQVASVSADVQEYAVAMEQYFFQNGYPKDLAGARTTAKKLTNLSLSPGNTIATYKFDSGAQEFQLCVENPSGASATYDTQPMSTVETTSTGGCP